MRPGFKNQKGNHGWVKPLEFLGKLLETEAALINRAFSFCVLCGWIWLGRIEKQIRLTPASQRHAILLEVWHKSQERNIPPRYSDISHQGSGRKEQCQPGWRRKKKQGLISDFLAYEFACPTPSNLILQMSLVHSVTQESYQCQSFDYDCPLRWKGNGKEVISRLTGWTWTQPFIVFGKPWGHAKTKPYNSLDLSQSFTLCIVISMTQDIKNKAKGLSLAALAFRSAPETNTLCLCELTYSPASSWYVLKLQPAMLQSPPLQDTLVPWSPLGSQKTSPSKHVETPGNLQTGEGAQD